MPRPKHYTIPVFVPELGCPHQCVFCNQRKISGMLTIPSIKETEESIIRHLATIPKENSFIEIGFFGGSFTGIDINIQKEFLSLATRYSQPANLQGIRLSTRPDYIDQERLDLLKEYGVTTVELGAQSMDDEVLRRSGRGHTAHDTEKAAAMIKKNEFRLGLQMMTGLPADTFKKSLITARQFVDLGADDVRIYPTLVIKDTVLADFYREGKYVPQILEEAVRLAVELCKIFDEAGIHIIRVGLHPSEGLITGKDLVAGPFFPSFSELVETEIWNENLQRIEQRPDYAGIKIFVAPDEYNHAIGYKAKNRKMLKANYKEVMFYRDPTLKGKQFYADHY